MFDAMETVKRIKIQCINKGISLTKMLIELNLNKSYLSESAKNKNGMSSANLYAIACYLQVSTDYLLSITDNPEIKR